MATRSIVTSQPDVACDVCGRRLLRGETPDTFLAGSELRTVCELCAPRAAQEGWRRGSESEALGMRPPRGRRGVSLLDRLRALREPGPRRVGPRERRADELFDVASGEQPGGYEEAGPHGEPGAYGEPEPYGEPATYERDLYLGAVAAERAGAEHASAPGQGAEAPLAGGGVQDRGALRALEVFNHGEQPRRVAGVSRSLGEPSVSVRAIAGSEGRYAIVVAWELCWYRYEVDLEDELAGVCMVEKGTELDELPAEDRLGNVAADERGRLQPVA
jgi:hypothetical protein